MYDSAYYDVEEMDVEVLSRGPHVSRITYTVHPGITFDIVVPNEELEFNDDRDDK